MRWFRPEKPLFEHRGELGTVQVVERDGRRELRFGNPIIQSAMSLAAPDVLALDYNRAMMAGFLFAPHARTVLQLGLGGGTLVRFVHRYFPQVRQVVVELSPQVVEVAHRFFDLPHSERIEMVTMDAADYLSGHAERFDLIIQDAYHADGVAAHLEAGAFLRLLDAHLAPGGWAVNNVWGSDRSHLNEMQSRMAKQFNCLFALGVRSNSNVILVGGQAPTPPKTATLVNRAQALEADVPLEFTALARKLRRLRPGTAQLGTVDTGMPL